MANRGCRGNRPNRRIDELKAEVEVLLAFYSVLVTLDITRTSPFTNSVGTITVKDRVGREVFITSGSGRYKLTMAFLKGLQWGAACKS
jgi:hypothetical protein